MLFIKHCIQGQNQHQQKDSTLRNQWTSARRRRGGVGHLCCGCFHLEGHRYRLLGLLSQRIGHLVGGGRAVVGGGGESCKGDERGGGWTCCA
jgi:hypothetical protein